MNTTGILGGSLDHTCIMEFLFFFWNMKEEGGVPIRCIAEVLDLDILSHQLLAHTVLGRHGCSERS